MRVVCKLVGLVDHQRTLEWPEGWPIPREGEEVDLFPDVGRSMAVRTVRWYPEGDEDDPEPVVSIVVGPPRPV